MGKMQPSEDHLEALADGRREGAAVRAYLDFLATQEPARRGRRRTAESISLQIVNAKELWRVSTDSIERLTAYQAVRDMERELEEMTSGPSEEELEAAFTRVALGYSGRKGIEWSTWRGMGVEARVLRAAGITPTSIGPGAGGGRPGRKLRRSPTLERAALAHLRSVATVEAGTEFESDAPEPDQ